MLGVRAKVMEGHTLADGLREFPRVFPEIYRSTVAAGESSGRLDGVLERLADYTENREVTRQKVLGACSTRSFFQSCVSASSPA
jgi:general secretion pathway protein F